MLGLSMVYKHYTVKSLSNQELNLPQQTQHNEGVGGCNEDNQL
jgi:hypothetical protein